MSDINQALRLMKERDEVRMENESLRAALSTAAGNYIIVLPDTVEETGLMVWLAERFKGKPVTLLFGTKPEDDIAEHPALWITPAPEVK